MAQAGAAFKNVPENEDEIHRYMSNSIVVTSLKEERAVFYAMSVQGPKPMMIYRSGLGKWRVCFASTADKEEVLSKGPDFKNNRGTILCSLLEETFHYEIRLQQYCSRRDIATWFESTGIRDEEILSISPVFIEGVQSSVFHASFRKKLPMGDMRVDGRNKAWIFATNEYFVKFSELRKERMLRTGGHSRGGFVAVGGGSNSVQNSRRNSSDSSALAAAAAQGNVQLPAYVVQQDMDIDDSSDKNKDKVSNEHVNTHSAAQGVKPHSIVVDRADDDDMIIEEHSQVVVKDSQVEEIDTDSEDEVGDKRITDGAAVSYDSQPTPQPKKKKSRLSEVDKLSQ